MWIGNPDINYRINLDYFHISIDDIYYLSGNDSDDTILQYIKAQKGQKDQNLMQLHIPEKAEANN